MKRNMKRCLAGVMTLVLALSLLPASVLAADTPQPIDRNTWAQNYYTPAELSGSELIPAC